MNPLVRRISVIHSGAEGPSVEDLYVKALKRRRKGSRLLRPVEKVQRRLLKTQKAFADEALAQHDKSARKRKDGWLWDAPVIVFKANRKALKELTNW